MTFAEQVSSLRFTRVLISIHGAGLSNIIFLQPGSTVIELMHPLMSAPFYRFLSYYASLNYILIKDVKPLNDSCVELHHWSPYLYYKLGVNWYQMNNTLIQSELIGLNTDSIKPS